MGWGGSSREVGEGIGSEGGEGGKGRQPHDGRKQGVSYVTTILNTHTHTMLFLRGLVGDGLGLSSLVTLQGEKQPF